MNWDLVIFYYLAIAMIFSSVFAIFSRHPVYTVLLVLVMIVHQAFLLLTLGAEFLTAVQIIVYAGAILVLFLFVVYLINLRKETKKNIFIRKVSLITIVFLLFGALLVKNLLILISLKPSFKACLPFNVKEKSNVWWIANYLFKNYLLQFEIIGVILLVAILGAVFLIRKVKTAE
ncbi:MAG: NADH:ubiquinone oxidoreductase subunit 6 [Thermodesulfobacterium sp.]|uniref:NADH-quinone oxidoreductase subunit J n=1 Tax=Candidatus Thermodesulfobacterium syntrophicum TaxID=3060442 RepID=A0AAE3P0E8_9BACT|nr:NADH:ubiquinone oxidoreductase subunit 6 [Candidatus Thermodesulfobacterium syntrophicum]